MSAVCVLEGLFTLETKTQLLRRERDQFCRELLRLEEDSSAVRREQGLILSAISQMSTLQDRKSSSGLEDEEMSRKRFEETLRAARHVSSASETQAPQENVSEEWERHQCASREEVLSTRGTKKNDKHTETADGESLSFGLNNHRQSPSAKDSRQSRKKNLKKLRRLSYSSQQSTSEPEFGPIYQQVTREDSSLIFSSLSSAEETLPLQRTEDASQNTARLEKATHSRNEISRSENNCEEDLISSAKSAAEENKQRKVSNGPGSNFVSPIQVASAEESGLFAGLKSFAAKYSVFFVVLLVFVGLVVFVFA